MNKATKCQAQGSRGFHIWMYLGMTSEGNRKETCSNTGCACGREVTPSVSLSQALSSRAKTQAHR